MPFLARCLFCGQQVRAPDHALGASQCCPKCSNFFTLAPHSQSTRCSSNAGLAQAPALGPSFPNPLPQAGLTVADPGPQPQPRRIDPLGPSALLLCGAALLCASAPALCRGVMPLSAAGLLLGLVAVLLAKGRSRLLFPVTATTAGGVVLLVAVLFPSILGPVYVASRAKEIVDPAAIRAVPLAGNSPLVGPLDPEWVDASGAALQQGPLQVQVLSASVRPKSSSVKTRPPAENLCIRLRTHQAEAASEFAAKRSQKPGRHVDQLRPTLRDNTGRVYQSRDVQEVAAVENQRKSALFPVSLQDEVLVFEAPNSGVEYLRLEVPAEVWGGRGAFRFTIPSSMIEFKASGVASAPRGPGR